MPANSPTEANSRAAPFPTLAEMIDRAYSSGPRAERRKCVGGGRAARTAQIDHSQVAAATGAFQQPVGAVEDTCAELEGTESRNKARLPVPSTEAETTALPYNPRKLSSIRAAVSDHLLEPDA